MAQQVSGSERTLIEAIRHGEVPRPPLMGWNDFQVWRRDHGKRPTQAVDGYVTETPVETALWRSVMMDLYGEDWSVRVAAGETGATERGPAASVPQPGSMSVKPSAGAHTEKEPGSFVTEKEIVTKGASEWKVSMSRKARRHAKNKANT